ncbi:putative P-loop containing nucleoside triphosphate hydrolase protein [Lyophyllum shimeji]|uniref:P-loop containing nucleoside triphosphate hydrolase protein n=1 Tax=Lyophyllum shimeji TaxID=47721 RepID=A0A9P3PF95_LYOSH|nr:putative P-loop containing nucleoside triphosphate hydrolase protein [Lyophyllum shimeji]
MGVEITQRTEATILSCSVTVLVPSPPASATRLYHPEFLPPRDYSRGIFDIVYDSRPSSNRLVLFNLPSREQLFAYAAYIQSMWRFIRDVHRVAPGLLISYTLCSLWIATAPAVSLSLCYSTLSLMEEAFATSVLSQDRSTQFEGLIVIWLVVEVFSVLLRRVLDNVALELTGHLKAHFLPRLARANLSLDVDYLRDSRQAVLHDGWSNHHNVQGLDLVQHLFVRARDIIALSLQLLVMLSFMFRGGSLGAQMPLDLYLAYLALLFATKYMTSAEGFIFFTENVDYHRQLSLHSIIYDNPYSDSPRFRQTVIKDGIAEYLGDEYRRVSDTLGVVPETPWHLATRPRSTKVYWAQVLQSLIVDHSLSLLCAFMLPFGLSASAPASLLFFQYATTHLRETARAVEHAARNGSFIATIRDADRLYEVLDNADIALADSRQRCRAYPPEKSSPSGMKLSFRHVSLWYNNSIAPALRDVSVDIRAGQLVLIVGSNGSGKSSLLNLVLRLVEPTSGEILIDDRPLGSYEIQALRREMTFLGQSDAVYPLSIRENLAMGLPYGPVDSHKLYRAAEAGGCLDLLRNSGDAVVDPPTIVSQSFDQGTIGPAAHAFLQQHDQQRRIISLSKGDKQRVAAARMFYRAINTNFRLLVIDAPASCMDASAESKLYQEFLNVRNNKTTIVVAHHFGTLAKQADLILCMSNGSIVQRGTHDQLMNEAQGEYAQLYRAQSAGLE